MRWALQMAVFVLLILFFALQIPSAALFFRPRRMAAVQPSVAFVELDGATYASVMRQVRTADGARSLRNWNGGALMDSDVGVGALEAPLPLPEPLPLARARTRTTAPQGTSLPPFRPSLAPPSLAAPPLEPMRGDPIRPAAKADDELLDLDVFETLKERK